MLMSQVAEGKVNLEPMSPTMLMMARSGEAEVFVLSRSSLDSRGREEQKAMDSDDDDDF